MDNVCSALAQETSSEFPYLRLYLQHGKTSVWEVTGGGEEGTVITSIIQRRSIWTFGNIWTISAIFHFLSWRHSLSLKKKRRKEEKEGGKDEGREEGRKNERKKWNHYNKTMNSDWYNWQTVETSCVKLKRCLPLS